MAPTALSTVLFPKFSENWQSKEKAAFLTSCAQAVRAALFISIPLTAVAYMLRESVVAFLLQRGAFSGLDAHVTADLFGMLILSTPATAASVFLYRIFYATQRTWLPTLVNITAAVLAIAVVPVLALRFGANGVAFAYMLLPWISCLLLLGLFQKVHGGLVVREIGGFSLRTTAIAGVSGWLGARLGGICAALLPAGKGSLTFGIGAGAVTAMAIFYFISLSVGLPEAVACRRCFR
jgi:putative peptidoglycan lipid II flippase